MSPCETHFTKDGGKLGEREVKQSIPQHMIIINIILF